MNPDRGDLETFRAQLLALRPIMAGISWTTSGFDVDKAYVCAVFSQLAYLKLHPFEVPSRPSVKIVPCYTHRTVVQAAGTFSFDQFVASAELGGIFFTHPTDLVIVTGAVFPDVVIIALRGTRMLYLTDWMVDFNAARIKAGPGGHDVEFHRGFYRELIRCLDPIMGHLEKLQARDRPIYVTGHSLGGALGAILNSVAGMKFGSVYTFEPIYAPVFPVHSCFTFGMPRYGDARAIEQLQVPHHLFNELDIVPHCPPRALGYWEVPEEHRLRDGSRKLTLKAQRARGPQAWLDRMIRFKGIRHHFIEEYVQRLAP